MSFWIAYAGLHEPGPSQGLHMPYAGMALAVWAGFLFEDEASSVVRNAPTPILLRRGLRVILALPVLALVWTALLAYEDIWSVAGTLTAGFAAQVSVALAFGALGVLIFDGDRAGLFAAAGVSIVFVAVPVLMKGGMLAPRPEFDTWWYLYGRWLLTSVTAVGLALLASRDPAARGVRSMVRILTGRDSARVVP